MSRLTETSSPLLHTRLLRSTHLRQIEQQYADQPLMLRAGTASAAWAAELCPDKNLPILIVAGPGNNGGDAMVAARLLQAQGFSVQVLYQVPSGNLQLPADAAAAHQAWQATGGQYVSTIPEAPRWGLIVDGIFGIGLKRAPAGCLAGWIAAINHLATRDACPVLALDCPSGLNADTGMALHPVVHASHTLTFLAAKPGLYTLDGPDYCGEIREAALGLHPEPAIPPDPADVAAGHLVSPALFARSLKPRRRNSHKGSYGSAGILGGAAGMTGAALLAGRAALHLGAGRVYLGLLAADAPGFDPAQAELMLRPATALLDAPLTALACGPGMGQADAARQMLEQALLRHLQHALPLVLDADALNLLAADPALRARLTARPPAHPFPAILTPHPAEAARLLACPAEQVAADRVRAALELARRHAGWIVLKGCGTVIAAPDGQWWINPTGNPGMASAGMGDVLTGMLTALLAQGWALPDAVLAGTCLHGLAADHCVAAGQGPAGLTAGELIPAARYLLNRWLAGSCHVRPGGTYAGEP